MRNRHTYHFPFVRYPALRLAFLLASGIVLANQLALSFLAWCYFLAGTLLLYLMAELYISQRPAFSHHQGVIAIYLLSIIAFGGWRQSLSEAAGSPPAAKLLSAFTWEDINAAGTIYNIRPTSTDKYQVDVTVHRTIFDDTLVWSEPYNLRTIYDPDGLPLPEKLTLGSYINFNATIYPLEPKSNPHEFDYKSFLASREIYSQAGITKIRSIKSAQTLWSWSHLRQWTINKINQNFGPETSDLAKALLMGYKNELNRADKIAFSRVGLSHIMAVSGLHVGFILAPFWFCIPFLWTLPRGKEFGLLLLVALLFVYAGLTGFSASVTRAAITGGLITYGRLFHKARDSINLTAVAALIILLLRPNELFKIGFQLSFAAVFIILLTLPVLQQFLSKRIRFRWFGKPVMIVLVSVAVQLGLYPLLSYYFGEFSLAGPLANALVVPGLMITVPLALLLLPFSAIFPTAGYLLNAPCRWFLALLQWFVTHAAGWQWSWIQTPAAGILLFGIWFTGILLIASLFIPKYRWKLLVLFLILLCLHQGKRLYHSLRPPILEVTILDVGQGDAALINTPSGKHVLIDAGRWTPNYNSARYVILPHLKAEGIQKLDAVFLSHPHADHIGGILELIRKIPIDVIYNSGFKYDSELYLSYLQLAAKKSIEVKPLQAGMRVKLDPLLRTFIYGPAPDNHSSDPNEHSLVVEFIYGDTQFLFMGDAGKAQERRLLQHFGPMLNTDFLKVGHHGSKTSSSDFFLQTVTPTFAAVSLGKDNKFRHPHPEAVHNLRESNARLLFTSLEGALRFSSNGSNIIRHDW